MPADSPDSSYQIDLQSKDHVFSGFFKVNRYRLRHTSFHGGWCGEITRERLEGLNAVSVLLYDPELDQVVVIEQFRIGCMEQGEGAWLLETVGGYREPDESREDVAHREVMEETGCKLLALEPITEFWVSPGVSSERISLMCGRVDASQASGIHGLIEEGEEIRVRVLPALEAIRDCYQKLNSTSALIALQWLALNRDALRQRWT